MQSKYDYSEQIVSYKNSGQILFLRIMELELIPPTETRFSSRFLQQKMVRKAKMESAELKW